MPELTDEPRILLVEDEQRIREGIADVLMFHGYRLTAVESGEEGLQHAAASELDLAILDVMLPGLSGFDVCREMRKRSPALPIMMLTAKGAEDDIVTGLMCGADDYMTKPFSIRELVARVQALLRRARTTTGGAPALPEEVQFGAWLVDLADLRATHDGATIDITPREARIIRVFVRDRGRIVSRRTLLKEVWEMSHPDEIETRTVDMHIAKLRKKIDRDGRSCIETVRGAGYRALLSTLSSQLPRKKRGSCDEKGYIFSLGPFSATSKLLRGGCVREDLRF